MYIIECLRSSLEYLPVNAVGTNPNKGVQLSHVMKLSSWRVEGLRFYQGTQTHLKYCSEMRLPLTAGESACDTNCLLDLTIKNKQTTLLV